MAATIDKTTFTIDETKYVTKVYDYIAQHFDKTRNYKWPWICKFINSFPKESLLYDIGCGNGRNMDYPGYTFKGVDNCQTFVDICTHKGYDVIKGDMTQLTFPNESADGILSIAAFHHLTTEERRLRALKEMKRVLKPSGKILLSVWSKTQPKKTRRVFDRYGDTLVKWNKHGEIVNRYYYIFTIMEIKMLCKTADLHIDSHTWDYGNEIFILKHS